MTDPFDVLKTLEERVKKAEDEIPRLKQALSDSETNINTQYKIITELEAKLAKHRALEVAFRDVFTIPSLTPSVSIGASGIIASQAIEVKDPSQIIEVEDPQEALQVSTISLRGQVAKLILEGKLGASLVNAKAVRHMLITEFGPGGEQWDIDTVLKELKALTAPPFRLFTFNPKNYMFRLRTGSEKRVKD